jgi:rhodanese-related sulfurtransferase
MNKEEQSSKIDNFMRYHVKKYPKLLKLYEDKKLKIKELPIVIYCYSKTCNSAHNLVLLMLKHGYSNIIEYPGGISEWQKHYDVDTNPFSKPKSASATASASASPSANKKKRTPKKSAGTQKSIKKINKINDSIQIKHINKGSNGINSAHMFRFLQ